MNKTYFDLVSQTFSFPQEGFRLEEDRLRFHEIDLYRLIQKYGTPLRLTYLPKISSQIQNARQYFTDAFAKYNYQGKYFYCFCTKSNHFRYVLEEITRNRTQLETSSAFDINLVRRLHKMQLIDSKTIILSNGFKTDEYAAGICGLIADGFNNVVPILDNKQELDVFEKHLQTEQCKIGLRIATEEEPNFEFYTSRHGIRQSEVLRYYEEKIKPNPKFVLKMLHFFVDVGIKDTQYYWSELAKSIRLYCKLYRVCPTLRAINIGGGFPIRTSLGFEYDYAYMVDEIIRIIHSACEEENIPHPDVFTEFGKYTVGESSATIFSVIGQKQQNDSERWYMVDNSLITTIPDIWAINERFIMLPVNYWNHEYRRVNIGGLSCDNLDYYNSEAHSGAVYLPKFQRNQEPLYLGFFHTGAYQDALAGHGGTKHCLLPSPKHVLVRKDEAGELVDELAFPEQKAEEMLRVLGY